MKNFYVSLAALVCAPILAFADGSYTSGVNTETSVSGNVTVSGKTELHLTSKTKPVEAGTVINLVDDNSWLYFDAVRPMAVVKDYLANIKVNGAQAVYFNNAVNVRVSEWGSGTVVIPNGNKSDIDCLTVYDQPNCKGESKTFGIFDEVTHQIDHTDRDTTYYGFAGRRGDLGEWDNRIKSFKLKKGYMVTFANNSDGTGHSRVWIADTDDIVVDIMPEGFVTYKNGVYDDATAKAFISSLRVFRWEWVGKKGWAGWNTADIGKSNAESYYVWGSGKVWSPYEEGGFYPINSEFVPIRQNKTDPKWYILDTISGVTHLLGYNEPDRPDQANATVENAIANWPNMLKTMYRLGSPAPASVWANWAGSFWSQIKLYNYRCDFDVVHIYEYTDDWASRITKMQGNSGGRPCWVTEYNYGANWTNETWPTQEGTKVDVDGNPILDSKGNKQTVKRPATADNLEHERKWTVKMMDIMENMDALERAYFYNWVEDARSYILNDKLTPAGKVFAEYVGKPGYKAAKSYNHVWKLAPASLTATADFDHEYVDISFYDHNGEMGKGYIIMELKKNVGWVNIDTVYRGVDYEGSFATVKVPYPTDDSATNYKCVAIGLDDAKSSESYQVTITKPAMGTPDLKVIKAEGTSVTFSFGEPAGVKTFMLRRGTAKDKLRTHASGITENVYVDTKTTPETVYYYQVIGMNPYCNNTESGVLRVYTGVAGIESVEVVELGVRAEAGNIIIESPCDCIVSIYSLDGRMVRKVNVIEGTNVVEGLSHGLYIVDHKKVAL